MVDIRNNNDITLVIFTSEGREHLLTECIKSFKSACDFNFSETILVIDGTVDGKVLSEIDSNLKLHHYKRIGYVKSILSALKFIKTPYFFWLEDDFLFNHKVPIDLMLNCMSTKKGTWAGIFLSRTAPLSSLDKKTRLFDDLYVPEFGFSVSPSLCYTDSIIAAFKELHNTSKNTSTKFIGFEPFIDNYFVENQLSYALLDPGSIAHVEHVGFMESTAREYHMINSVDNDYSDVGKHFISGLGKETVITLYNKLAMIPKLWMSISILVILLFYNLKAYDYAFRIYSAYMRKFKF